MAPIETMSWTASPAADILYVAECMELLEGLMFPRCANSECPATFGSFREGTFFRFRRTSSEGRAPTNSHSVDHAWLCTRCSENYSLEYRENHAVLTPLIPAMLPIVEVPRSPEPPPKRSRVARAARRRRPSSRRASAQPPANNPLIVLAIAPRGDFIDRA